MAQPIGALVVTVKSLVLSVVRSEDGTAQPIGPALRVVFWVVAVLTGLTGLTMFLAPQLAGQTLWPWPLTPLVSRYLGGLFVGVGVGAGLCTRAADWSQVRLLFPPGLTFTGLSLVAAALHAGSFNPARPVTWAFFAVYVVIFVAGLVAYLRYERVRPTAAASSPPAAQPIS